MTSPVQAFRRQGQYFKGKGVGSQNAYDGAYTAELFAKGDIAAAATQTSLVAAAGAGKKIRVLSYGVSALAAGATTVVFNSASTAISHVISLAANGNAAESAEAGLFETAANAALTVTTGAGAGVGVRVTYIVVD